MKEKSQTQFIKDELLINGKISRNYCLELYHLKVRPSITKLNTLISHMKLHENWKIDTKVELDSKGNEDYVYYLVQSPLKRVVYRIPALDKEIVLFV